MNILIGPLRFVPFAADIPVSLLVAVHFEQRVERLEVGGEIGDVVLQEQGVLLGKGDLQPGEHVVAPGKGAGDIRGYVFVVGETQVRIHDAVGGGEVALETTLTPAHSYGFDISHRFLSSGSLIYPYGGLLVIGFPSLPFACNTAFILRLQSRRYHSFMIFKKGANSLLVLISLSTPLEIATKWTPFSRKNTSV